MLRRRSLLLAAAVAATGALLGCDDKLVTVYLVRHAEKADARLMADPQAAKDPELSGKGKRRAAALPAALDGAKLSAVFSSPYKRTQQTVTPAAAAQGLPVQAVDAGDIDGLVAKIKALPPGGAALVAGHSNTVPAIIQALGVEEPVKLEEDDYGDLLVIRLDSSPALERRRFGE